MNHCPVAKKYAVLFVLLMIIILLFSCPVPAQGNSPAVNKHVDMLVIDKLSLDDISPHTTPTLYSLMQKGSSGLCSNRTLGPSNSVDACLTIGSGNLADASGQNIAAFNHDEIVSESRQAAGQRYKNLTGKNPGNHAVLVINYPGLVAGMAKSPVATRLGLLGQILSDHGIPVCVLGNGDYGNKTIRLSAAIAMDSDGRVPLGDVGPKTTRFVGNSFVFTQTDYAYLEKKLNQYRQEPLLNIIELSDLSRLEQAPPALPAVQQLEREKLLRQIDHFIKVIARDCDLNKDLLLIVVPSPPSDQLKQKNTFVPLIINGPGYSGGFLTSATTRQDGIVASTDITPTILKFFGLKDSTGSSIGQPIYSGKTSQADPVGGLIKIAERMSLTNRVRAPLIQSYVILQLGLISLAMLALILARPLAARISRWLSVLLTAPLVFLLLGACRPASEWQYYLLAIGANIIFVIIMHKLFGSDILKCLVLISGITLTLLNLDIIFGSHLIQHSVLGYDLMSGARYYGVGNEYVGVLIGSCILVGSAIYQRYTKPYVLGLIGFLFLIQCVVLAHPDLGAQSDGLITAPISFLATLVLLSGNRLDWKRLAIVLAGSAAIICAGVFYDMTRAVELQSHIGRTANHLAHGFFKDGLSLLYRKMQMNLKVFNYTAWTKVFLAILAALAVLLYIPVGAMARVREKAPVIFKGFIGILIGALAGGAINDSGIILAATMSLYLIIPMLAMMLQIIADS